jgi:restriction system protein
MRHPKGPEFIRFFHPILEVLLQSGGSGTASEIVDRSLELTNISEAEQEAVNKNGLSRVKNQVHWARQYLVWAGYLDSSRRGVWGLTDKGTTVNLTAFNALEVFKGVQSSRAELNRDKKQSVPEADDPIPSGAQIKGHRTALLNLIKSLSPGGFERLSQRLLRESGFQHVSVTGKSGDGGIDGIGTLQMNPFVSFNVLFQCKRYQGAVTPIASAGFSRGDDGSS